jgi:hypothetical protein
MPRHFLDGRAFRGEIEAQYNMSAAIEEQSRDRNTRSPGEDVGTMVRTPFPALECESGEKGADHRD